MIAPSTAAGALCRLIALDGSRNLLEPTIDGADWDSIVACANRHLLVAVLHQRIAGSDAPDEVVDYCAYIRRLNRKRNFAVRRQVEELIEALARVAVTPLLLKGAACLFDGPYEDVSVRFVGDIDILVDPLQLGRCLDALRRGGYRISRRYADGHNAYGDFIRVDQPSAVDLHIQPVDCWHLMSASEIVADAQSVPCGRYECLIPGPTHRVLHNILHAEIHHLGGYFRGGLPLRDMYELAYAMRAWRDRIDWHAIIAKLSDPPLRTVVESYLLTQNRLLNGDWPLEQFPGRRARAHFARRVLQDRHPWLERCLGPWANVRAAFSHHRMKALHGGTSARFRRLAHLSQFLARHSPADGLSRLFRR